MNESPFEASWIYSLLGLILWLRIYRTLVGFSRSLINSQSAPQLLIYPVTCFCQTVSTGVRRRRALVSDKGGWGAKLLLRCNLLIFLVFCVLPQCEEKATGEAGYKKELTTSSMSLGIVFVCCSQ